MQRNVYDLSKVFPETSMTEEQWTEFFKALVYVMPDETIDSMREYAKTKPARRKASNVAKNAETEQH
eukprot:2496407-Karenia_brevis.AAC.1